MEKTIFEKIMDREIPADIIYENDLVLAFKDIAPVAPHHYLVIPKKRIKSLQEVSEEDSKYIVAITKAIQEITADKEMDSDGYRVVTNIGKWGGQTVFHLHFHIIGGRQLSWEF